MSLKSLVVSIMGMVFALTLANVAHAQPKPKPLCGITAVGATGATIKYDPFGTSGLQQVDVPLVITRKADGAEKTQQVFFILSMPNDAPDYQITATGPNNGGDLGKILYRDSEVMGSNRPIADLNASDQIHYNFGGATQPDSVTFNLKVTVPPGADLRAGLPITFGIWYLCDGTGGMQDVKTTALYQPSAVSINVRVMSALRAFYAGSALDFGEIGTVPNPIGTALVQTAPDNRFGVLSSGAYRVSLKSDNGFRLSNGGPTANDLIRYKLRFIGRDLDSTTPNATTEALRIDCNPGGLSIGDSLPVQGTLQEGGAGKNPAPNYSDVLTVTFEPLIDASVGTQACGGI
jgi:hypothetical protein